MAEAERELETQLLTVKLPRRTTIERLVGYAKVWLSLVHTTFRPVIQPVATKVAFKGNVQLPDGRIVTVRCPIHIVEPSQIGFWRVCPYNQTVQELKYVYAYHLASLVSHSANVYVLVLSRSHSEVLIRRWVTSELERRWCARTVQHAIDGAAAGHFPPCETETPWCRPYRCHYWHACRKEDKA